MTINVDQNDELEKQQLSQDTADLIKFSGESRRRFATSGLAVSGIILTLASRPVLGDTFCLSPSGFISGNTSQHGNCPIPVALSAVKYYARSDVTLISAFPHSLPDASYNSRLLSDMLTTPWPEPRAARGNARVSAPSNPPLQNPPLQTQELLKHLVIALLRARGGATPFLTVSTIQSMLYEWQASGTFAPTAGVIWNASQLIEYLKLTQN